ncbi:uncharacterized protein C16orf52 homolog B isoform X4 [Schistocerca gregaria]|uniref:uncharacterized protein C16orf52 homolog B isoform X4 n=1 Tax=Schistocerca gregaria TaxID=7010 RepID=UPI00211E0509|nr:uncharacterized protein C16orf52 homolog B isoform X4 [Schistocerca gregaria]
MDKLTLISGTLFLAADIFAIVSLAMPDWITTEVGGDTRLGLMWTCMTLYNRQPTCFTPDLQPEWLLALVCIFVGCICITTTIILLISSHWDRNVVPYARWVGFTAMEMLLTLPDGQGLQQTMPVNRDNRAVLVADPIIYMLSTSK